MVRHDRSSVVRGALAAATAIALAGGVAGAQTPDSEGWRITVAPYAFGAALDGRVAVRGREVDVDLSASDLVDRLELGFMAMTAARKGDWGIVGDALWVALGESVEMPPADLDTDLTIVTVQGLRRLGPAAELTFGARYQQVRGEIDLGSPVDLGVERTLDWVDPIVGLVLRTPGDRRWRAMLIADLGGFGAGSDLTWQVLPSIGVELGDRASLEIGWRVIDTDYEQGDGAGRFAWDMRLQGPAIGFAYRF